MTQRMRPPRARIGVVTRDHTEFDLGVGGEGIVLGQFLSDGPGGLLGQAFGTVETGDFGQLRVGHLVEFAALLGYQDALGVALAADGDVLAKRHRQGAGEEPGESGGEDRRHRGMHLFEDLVIPEVVDDQYRPVPPGQPGDRLLVTLLFSRTLPLIRYEMSDRATLATQECPDGLPFPLLDSIEGRTDDIVVLPTSTGGTIRIHPVVFNRVLDLLDAPAWQVRQHGADITLLIAAPGPQVDIAATEHAVKAALAQAGAQPRAVSLSIVDNIPAGAAGKRPLIVADKAVTAQA
jgi:hypothetical protein